VVFAFLISSDRDLSYRFFVLSPHGDALCTPVRERGALGRRVRASGWLCRLGRLCRLGLRRRAASAGHRGQPLLRGPDGERGHARTGLFGLREPQHVRGSARDAPAVTAGLFFAARTRLGKIRAGPFPSSPGGRRWA
jgi:hypothetical protein